MEKNLQHQIVKAFSNKYPELHGCLFEVNNDCKGGIRQIQYRIAMGMIPGASDLVLFANNICTFIECKDEKTKQSKSHIGDQLRFGRNMVIHGGNYIMSSDFGKIMYFIDCAIDGMKRQINIDEIYLKM